MKWFAWVILPGGPHPSGSSIMTRALEDVSGMTNSKMGNRSNWQVGRPCWRQHDEGGPRHSSRSRIRTSRGQSELARNNEESDTIPLDGPRTVPYKAGHPEGWDVECAGGGIYFFWQLGFVEQLFRYLEIKEGMTWSKKDMRFSGSSAGALISVLAASDVIDGDPANVDRVVTCAADLCESYGVWEKPVWGLFGIWKDIIAEWLDILLPEDSADRCNGRVSLGVTRIDGFQLPRKENLVHFENRRALITSALASVHIPMFMDGKFTFVGPQGQRWIDGSTLDILCPLSAEEERNSFWIQNGEFQPQRRRIRVDPSLDREGWDGGGRRPAFAEAIGISAANQLVDKGRRFANSWLSHDDPFLLPRSLWNQRLSRAK
mmetsp:Transcript_16764/g.34545  ORF Transcript_16764/g.34545 Transcript_16764/m.34545 type:complete len:375 (-) Transcript_16764:145-1269(-)|eukprot:CAMPEP_0184687726 /NCGR_PEP_ID=MMETSP0312-20130426/27399_1 /TAXON_ID=31354 /ORGANISM="Compsopogon coeruleus, Strain SAG 36.94" /LENGTH=374 /DNA_ID=CAMNT_0027144167 /DNA_START=81 /DNA_END=1205 /DNA_ORIENTATION=-